MGEARTPHTATIPLATARWHRAIPNRDASNASQVLLLLDFILSMIVWRRRQPLVGLAVPISTGSGSAYLTLGRLWGLRWPIWSTWSPAAAAVTTAVPLRPRSAARPAMLVRRVGRHGPGCSAGGGVSSVSVAVGGSVSGPEGAQHVP